MTKAKTGKWIVYERQRLHNRLLKKNKKLEDYDIGYEQGKKDERKRIIEKVRQELLISAHMSVANECQLPWFNRMTYRLEELSK